jgi:hypothetical protein
MFVRSHNLPLAARAIWDRRAGRSRATRRRGYGSLLFVFGMVIFVLLLALVLNYSYLAFTQLRTSDVTDTLARTAVSELLDDSRLNPTPTVSQADDVDDAEQAVSQYLAQFNAAAAANQQLRYVIGSNDPALTDIYVTPFYVDDVTSPLTTGGGSPNATTTPPAGVPLNTLRVESLRDQSGGNPLYAFIRFAQTPEKVEINTASYATLDSRLIGFQPTPTANTPIVPIALRESAWLARASNVGGSAIIDFQGQMRFSNGGGPQANIVLVNFRDNATVDPSEIDDQVRFGTSPSQINIDDGNPGTPSNFLGPVVPGVQSRTLPAQDNTPGGAQTQAIVNALNDVAGSDDPRRIFPLYGTFNNDIDTANIVGFVAARVLQAIRDNPGMPNERLRIVLEPEFIVHFTAVTARTFTQGINSFDVPENVYIHKIRLAR